VRAARLNPPLYPGWPDYVEDLALEQLNEIRSGQCITRAAAGFNSDAGPQPGSVARDGPNAGPSVPNPLPRESKNS
jgi:hypothetical protein